MMKRIIKNAIKHQTKDLMHSIQNHNLPPQQDGSAQIVEGGGASGGQIDSAALGSSLLESNYPAE
jgi:hypothetical protein